MEQTLVLLKPDALEANLVGEIIKRYEDGGLKVKAISGPFMAEDAIISKHYPLDDYNYVLTLGHVDVTGWDEAAKKEKYDKSYRIINNLQKAIKSGPIIKMILEGENAVEKVRQITGKTDPASSPKGTIRGDLGTDTFADADKESRSVRNLVHASGSVEEAAAEIKLWFGESY